MELTVLAIEPGVVHSMARLVVLRQPNAFITPTSLSMLNGLNFHVAAEGGGE